MPDHSVSEPSMDDILASIRRIISEDAPVADLPPNLELQMNSPASPQAAPDPEPRHGQEAPAGVGLVGEQAAVAAASAFESLAATAHEAAAPNPPVVLPAPGRTLEDLTADLLRPLLKTWLDENLADIVRDRVDEEVRRIARSRVR